MTLSNLLNRCVARDIPSYLWVQVGDVNGYGSSICPGIGGACGMQFEQATLADPLVPKYNKSETLDDVDLVQRLLEQFLVQEQTEGLESQSTVVLGKARIWILMEHEGFPVRMQRWDSHAWSMVFSQRHPEIETSLRQSFRCLQNAEALPESAISSLLILLTGWETIGYLSADKLA